MRQAFCVHSETPYTDEAVVCGKPIFRRYHGWLCLRHYREQQDAIPAAPRKPQSRYKGNIIPRTDDELIRQILDKDAADIANGVTHVKAFGVLDPVYLRCWTPPTVN